MPDHTLSIYEISAHNHNVRSTMNQVNTCPEDSIGFVHYKEGGYYRYVNNYNWTYVSTIGEKQSHSHGNTNSASNIPKHVVVYL